MEKWLQNALDYNESWLEFQMRQTKRSFKGLRDRRWYRIHIGSFGSNTDNNIGCGALDIRSTYIAHHRSYPYRYIRW